MKLDQTRQLRIFYKVYLLKYISLTGSFTDATWTKINIILNWDFEDCGLIGKMARCPIWIYEQSVTKT